LQPHSSRSNGDISHDEREDDDEDDDLTDEDDDDSEDDGVAVQVQMRPKQVRPTGGARY